jgi:hypothetical protein
VQRQRGRVESWKHSKKVVGRDYKMPILSKLLGLNSKTEYPRDRDALLKGILPHNP